MNGFDEIQDMWLEQPLKRAPQVEDIRAAIKKYKTKTNRPLTIQISLLMVSLAVFIYMLLCGPSVTLTARIGILLFIVSIIYGVFLKINAVLKTRRMQVLSAKEFISQLEEEKTKTCTGSANEQARIFILFCVAYIFYIYGGLSQNITALIITYSAIALMLGLLWFVIRPYSARKRRKRIQSLISKLEQIKNEEL
ncbi:hypothetical protein [Pinibacter soli]|uniref:Uncharacterized protein n=1 Tax=Pinibacter soli TaxID=3044211 RepID=A0ABT6RIT7_9BACT|nr:hypothetical protein [Pinibacter soli]MDI3322480.1 hypothetical protein [Pinibacter soli]